MKTSLIENRQIRVFISSTFRDMQDERNYLMKRTFPKLRKLAAERDVTLTELDLRWGITEEEAKSGKVVEICLREIENSIPFFIGIIGNRYGWVPKKSDLGGCITERFPDVNKYIEQHLSVTEMEMQFGVLQRKEDMHAYFYIKEQEENPEKEDYPEMLNRLKQEVYKSKYPSSSYKSPEDLAQQVEEAFVNLLDSLFPDGNLSELEKERIGQRSFLNQLCQNYIKDEKNFDALDSWLADEDSHQFVVTGASGLGKSALIANWLKQKLSDNSCEYKIIYHFTGNGGSESNSEHITKAIANEIKDIYGWEYDNSETEVKLEDLFIRVSAESNKPLLIVIDAINQIVDVDNAKLLNWLPAPTKGIKILFSTLEDDRTMEVFKHREYPIFTLQPLDIERRSQLVRNYLKLYAKSLTDQQVRRIATDSQCENTLVLKTLLDELINFGIYEKLDERIEYYLAAESIDDFYQALLASYEDDFGREYVMTVISIIALSKYGLNEEEILAIVSSTPLAWSQLYCSFISQLVSKKGIISFSHSYVREAVSNRYLVDVEETNLLRDRIIQYFEKDDSPRSWEELLYQYHCIGDTASLASLLQNIKVFNCIVKEHVDEIAVYVRTIIDSGFNPFKYIEILRTANNSDKRYSLFINFFVQYCSMYELGLSLCEDYQSSLENVDVKLNEEESYEKLYIWKGIINRCLSKYQDALAAFNEAYQVCQNKYGENHLHTSLALKHIGTIYNAQRNYEKAEEYYKKALIIQQKLSYDKEAIDTTHCIANNYLDKREFDKAEEYLTKALKATRDLHGEDNAIMSTLYNSLGALYNFKEKYDESIKYAKKSIALDTKLYGKYNIKTAYAYHNIAGTYCDLNQLDDAQIAYSQAIEIKSRLFGANHYETCISQAGLGNVYKQKREYDKAIECHTRYLESYKDTFGDTESYIAVILAGIGEDYYGKEDYGKALTYHKDAVDVLEKCKEPIPSSYYNCIGNDLYYLNRYDEAVNVYQKGMECEDALTKPYIRSILLNCIARSYACNSEYYNAKRFFEEALEIRRQLFSEDDSRVIQCINNVERIKEILSE